MKRVALFLSLLLLPALSLAAQEDPFYPAYHRVVGVRADDVLNLRAGPGAGHEIVATLAPGADRVVAIRQSDDGRWALVRIDADPDHVAGWAALRYLERLPGQDDRRLPPALSCSGSEPFWSLEIGPQAALYSDLLVAGARLERAWDRPALNRRPRQYGLALNGAGAQIRAVITRGLCSDGMSDRIYGFSASVIRDGAVGQGIVTGCCALP